MKTLAMFPGQGSQFVGMGKDLVDQFPYTKDVFEEAEDSAKIPIRKLCFDGPESELRLTANTQPTILTVSVAAWKVLQEEVGFAPSHFAGHSLGEYSALVASGRLALGRAAFLVRKRGEAMQSAVPNGHGSMAAVMKMSAEELESLCDDLSSDGHIVQIANYNSPQQLVLAGHTSAVDRIVEVLAEKKVKAVKLAVSAPFHSALMAPAKEAMADLINDTQLKDADSQIFANTEGKLVTYQHQHLIDQIDSPVRWTQTMSACLEEGVERYVEVGPGKVLFGLARRTLPRGEIRLHHTERVTETLKEL